jgi:replication-associated recombination protein RarA
MVLSDVPVSPCILYGNSGTGKSSIMAEIAMKVNFVAI